MPRALKLIIVFQWLNKLQWVRRAVAAAYLCVLHQPTASKRQHHLDQPVMQATVAWICVQAPRFCCKEIRCTEKKKAFFPLLILLLFKSTQSSLKVSELKHSMFLLHRRSTRDNLTNKCPKCISWFLPPPWLQGCQLTHLSIFEAGSRRELGMRSFCRTQSRAG